MKTIIIKTLNKNSYLAIGILWNYLDIFLQLFKHLLLSKSCEVKM